MKNFFCGAASLIALTQTSQASELAVSVQIPALNVAEYHRPYVAIWLENDSQKFVANLSVWYDLKKRDNGGTKWLKDLRQWWRKSGRDLTMPVDGVSGATRNVGEHQLTFNDKNTPLNTLAAGRYHVVVEAAREGGGREVVRVPFDWKTKKASHAKAQGKEELGTVTVLIKP